MTAADHANTGVDILAVAKKFAPEVVYLRLVELEAAEAERDRLADALLLIPVKWQAVARAALAHTEQP